VGISWWERDVNRCWLSKHCGVREKGSAKHWVSLLSSNLVFLPLTILHQAETSVKTWRLHVGSPCAVPYKVSQAVNAPVHVRVTTRLAPITGLALRPHKGSFAEYQPQTGLADRRSVPRARRGGISRAAAPGELARTGALLDRPRRQRIGSSCRRCRFELDGLTHQPFGTGAAAPHRRAPARVRERRGGISQGAMATGRASGGCGALTNRYAVTQDASAIRVAFGG
jgi:hypothetical protein